MSDKKTQKVGVIAKVKTKAGKEMEVIRLGNTKNTDPKYNYTVQIRVLDTNGNVITTKTNPTLTMWNPKGDRTPEWLVKNLTVNLVDFTPQAQE